MTVEDSLKRVEVTAIRGKCEIKLLNNILNDTIYSGITQNIRHIKIDFVWQPRNCYFPRTRQQRISKQKRKVKLQQKLFSIKRRTRCTANVFIDLMNFVLASVLIFPSPILMSILSYISCNSRVIDHLTLV